LEIVGTSITNDVSEFLLEMLNKSKTLEKIDLWVPPCMKLRRPNSKGDEWEIVLEQYDEHANSYVFDR